MERLFAHREQPIPTLSDVRPDVPGSLDPLFRRMMSKSPPDRVSSLDELIADLERCLPGPGREGGAGVVRRHLLRAAPAGAVARCGSAGPRPGSRRSPALLATLVLFNGRRPEARGPSKATIAQATAPVVAGGERIASARAATAGAAGIPARDGEAASPSQPKDAPPAVINRGPAPSPVVAAKPTRPAKAEPVGLIREFKGHEGRVNGVAVSADGSRLISGGQDRSRPPLGCRRVPPRCSGSTTTGR